MAPTVHIIDPNPDTVVVLKNPCTTFAPWDPEEEQQKPMVPKAPELTDAWVSWSSTKWSTKKGSKKKIRKRVESKCASEPLLLSASFEPIAGSSTQSLEDGSTAFAEALSADQPTPSLATNEEPLELDESLIHYHVSSRHLMLASPVFRRALTQGGFAESVRNEFDNLYYVEAHDWDAEAFLIVLRIIHNRNKQVPRKVTLEILAKIAVLEDYYNFGESLDVFTEAWIRELIKVPTPTIYCRDLVLWVWVAWVFDIEQQFTEATTTAIKQSTESFRVLDLPIPTIVSGEIDSKRYQAIEAVVGGLYQRIELYRGTSYVCLCDSQMSVKCSSFLLGGMIKELSRLGLYQPRPEVPFPDMSFMALCRQVQDMNSPSWLHSKYDHHPCTLSAATTALVAVVSSAVGGLHLSDLKIR